MMSFQKVIAVIATAQKMTQSLPEYIKLVTTERNHVRYP